MKHGTELIRNNAEPKDAGSIPGHGGSFSDKRKSKNAFEILGPNLETSITALPYCACGVAIGQWFIRNKMNFEEVGSGRWTCSLEANSADPAAVKCSPATEKGGTRIQLPMGWQV